MLVSKQASCEANVRKTHMKRLYVRSHTPRIVLVALIKEEEFERALFYLSTSPLQSFLYETQGKELYGNKLKKEVDELIDYAKKNQKIFWYCEGNRKSRKKQPTSQITSLPTPGEVWTEFDRARTSQKLHGKLVEITCDSVAIRRQGQHRK